MARAYSQDLRDRVIKTALGGVSVRQAAARHGVWHFNCHSVGAPRPIRRGGCPPAGSTQRLQARCACGLSPGADRRLLAHQPSRDAGEAKGGAWRLRRHRHTVALLPRAGNHGSKKPCTPASATGPTSELREKLGLTGSWISTRNGWCSSMRPVPRPRWLACTDAVREASACGLAFRMGTGRPRPLWQACV